MKKMFISAIAIWGLAFLAPVAVAQKQVSMTEGSLAWNTKSKQAKKLYATGVFHMMNAEAEQAYRDFKAAVDADPSFTLPLAYLANLSFGETKKAYVKRAQAAAANKTEGEKLFVSLVDENSTPESRREIWGKLYMMYPGDRAIGHVYTITRATPEERFAAMTDYVQKFPEEPGMYNMLGYHYLTEKKDNVKAKEYFEKYIQLYPEGANPYDSMGEYYLTIGDKVNAEKYYTMALERYPFMISAVNAIEKLKAEKKKDEKKI